MATQVEEKYKTKKYIFLLLLGVLAGPTLWFLDLVTRYALVQVACQNHWVFVLHIPSIIAFVLTVLAGVNSWIQRRAVGARWPSDLEPTTVNNETIHALQHLSFFGSVLLFWWAVMHGGQRAMGYGVAVLYMFTTGLHSGLLGTLVTFAGSILYPIYAPTTGAWGLTPLQDQQLGGLIMCVPAGVVYIIAALALFAGWLRESDAHVRAWEEKIKGDLLSGTSDAQVVEL